VSHPSRRANSLPRPVWALLIAVIGAGAYYAVSYAQLAPGDFYEFELGQNITDQAADIAIEPRFRGLTDDRFVFEVDFVTTRDGTIRHGDEVVNSFRRSENWGATVGLAVQEKELEGRRDARLGLRYKTLQFLIDNGEARYSGYISPELSKFHEIQADGSRNEVTNIPGWAGVNARSIESARANQAQGDNSSLWVNVDNYGRLYGETYFANHDSPDQRNYPGRFLDPMHLALSIVPQFAPDTSFKAGETARVRRQIPLGAIAGARAEFDVTYSIETVYGNTHEGQDPEPTAVLLRFTAEPVNAELEARVAGMNVTYIAPEITDGVMLLDLTKGMPARVSFSYRTTGTASSGEMNADFSVRSRFVASMRRADAGE
jgi:hypothetical protein